MGKCIIVGNGGGGTIKASKIVGQLSAENIPNLDASKITNGTFSTDRIPSLNADKITSGILPISRGGTGIATSKNLNKVFATAATLPSGTTTAAPSFRALVEADIPNINVSKITGTLPFAKGGTGATSRLAAAKALTEENVGSSAQYFVTLTNSWKNFGYSGVGDARTSLKIPEGCCYVGTDADKAAKIGSYSNFRLLNGMRFLIYFIYTNTAASALTLNINSTGALPIYIDGTATSSSLYGISRGFYLCTYLAEDTTKKLPARYYLYGGQKYYAGTGAPNNKYGANGDIYIRYAA